MRQCWLLLIVAVLISSCTYEEVTLNDIRNFRIENVENRQIYFSFDARIVNPNAFALKISDSDLQMEINGVDMGQLYLSEAVKIPAGNDEFVPVRASVLTAGSSQGIVSILLGSVLSRAVDVRLKGEVKGGLIVYSKRIPVDHSERIEWGSNHFR